MGDNVGLEIRHDNQVDNRDYNLKPEVPVQRCFFDYCDELDTHLEEGHAIIESIIGKLIENPNKMRSNIDEVETCSINELRRKLNRIVSRTASLIAQLKKIGNSF